MNSTRKSDLDSINDNCLNMPYMEIMFSPSDTSMFFDSQALDLNQVQISNEDTKEIKFVEVIDSKPMEKSADALLNKIKGYSGKPEANHLYSCFEKQLQVIHDVVGNGAVNNGSNLLGNEQSNCKKEIKEVAAFIPLIDVNGKESISEGTDSLDKWKKAKKISCIHPSAMENFSSGAGNSQRKGSSSSSKISNTSSSINLSEDNFESLEESQTKLYLGKFTKKNKFLTADLELNEIKAAPDIDSICNGLIIEIYHHWVKQRYKISRLCEWIRGVCPHHLELTDSSLYVKIKNLIKMKHKQLIRSKTKKFEGCFESFLSGPFFKSDNLLKEEFSNETPKEKLLRIELKKAHKTIHRQAKEIGKKNSIINSISYDLTKLTKELDSLKEINKLVKKDNRSLFEKKSVDDSGRREEDLKQQQMIGSERMKRSDHSQTPNAEGNKRGRKRSKAQRKLPALEIKDYYSVSWAQNGEDESASPDMILEDLEGGRSKNGKRGKANSKEECIVSSDKRLHIKLEPIALSEGVLRKPSGNCHSSHMN